MKKRISNIPSATLRINSRPISKEPRRAGTSLHSGCENCEFSVPAGGKTIATLICRHKADTDLPWQVVDADGACRNFERSRELVALDIAAALAEGARLIPLTQDKFAIVDAEDYERLNKYKWCISKTSNTNYALRRIRGKMVKGKRGKHKTILMHRFILNAPGHLVVDHINHNGLDNRKKNLRLCTQAQNLYNTLPRLNCTSQFKGVYWDKCRNLFAARLKHKGKRYFIGRFKNEIDAAKAYDKKARELFGEFAYLNFPDP